MPEKWTGRLVGRMHNERIRYDELAAEMGVTKAYVSMILNGKRNPAGIRRRMEEALDHLLDKKQVAIVPGAQNAMKGGDNCTTQ